ncbi:MAG: dockerin type I domain-containing protein [Candidatus Hydrogenedentales bacterium]
MDGAKAVTAVFIKGRGPEDINQDGAFNAVDVQLVINAVLGISVEFDCDVNRDGAVNAVDVQQTINAVLNVP